MNKNIIEYFRRAMKIYSFESRVLKLTEEVGELFVAITHHKKKQESGIDVYQDKLNVIEEIADVELLLDNLKDFYLNGDLDFYDKIKEKKTAKFINHIDTMDFRNEFDKSKKSS